MNEGGHSCTHLSAAARGKNSRRTYSRSRSRIVKKASGLNVALNVQHFGAANRIYWVVRDIESLDDFQKQMALLLADPDYLAKVGEAIAGEYFIPGSFEDLLLQSVDV